MSAAVDGREVAGILVADPESTDRTTGRIPQLSTAATQAAYAPERHHNGDNTVNEPDYLPSWPDGIGNGGSGGRLGP